MQARLSQHAPVGVFDSGVGGLTVLRALRERLPFEDFIYLGDTARVPYGRKPPEMVRDFARQITGFLVSEGVKAVVIACNTATSVVPPGFGQDLGVPVFGVIEPGVAAARAVASEGTVGIIATRGTVASRAYQTKLEEAGLDVWAQACPLLVPIVEEGLVDTLEAQLLVRHYLSSRPHLDALILGCTHYPVLKHIIDAELNGQVPLVDSAAAIASVVANDLAQRNALNPGRTQGEVVHYVTGDPMAYQHTARTIGNVEGELRLLEIERLLAHGYTTTT